MNYLKKVYLKYEHRGLGYVIHYFLKKVGIKTKYSSFIHKKKYLLEEKVFKKTKEIVSSGYYKNQIIEKEQNWNIGNDTDLSSKLLGFYEIQVQKKIVDLKNQYDLKYLVNFGAAEGYHAIGLVKNNYFEECYCFEEDEKTREVLHKSSIRNKVEDKIKIYGKANFEETSKLLDQNKLKKTLFLVDIEGGEFSLFNESSINIFKNSIILIENHEEIFPNKILLKEFYQLMNNYFKKEILLNNGRNPFNIKELEHLPDDDRWLLMSEGRPCEMNWLVFTPQHT
jgi:hypothetical protein